MTEHFWVPVDVDLGMLRSLGDVLEPRSEKTLLDALERVEADHELLATDIDANRLAVIYGLVQVVVLGLVM